MSNVSYIPSAEALKFIAFIRAAGVEENANAEIHYRLADKYFSTDKQVLIEAFRGSAKSTMMEWLIIYTATLGTLPGFGKVDFIAFIGDSMENGVKNTFRNIAGKIDKSPFLQQLVKIQRKTDNELELVNVDGHELDIKGYGAGALALDTKLYADDGYTTIGSCKVGDRIYGADGKLATIITKSEVFNKPSYKMVLADGRSLVLSDDHINNVLVRTSVGNKNFVEQNITTKELLKIDLKRSKSSSPDKEENMVYIKSVKPVEYTEKNLPIEPYLLGYALGDGSFQGNQVRLHVQTKDYEELLVNLGDVSIGKVHTDTRFSDDNPVKSFGVLKQNEGLRKLKLGGVSCKGKFVPEVYKVSSKEQRIALLQGLMDSDGTIDVYGRRSRFSNTSKQLVEDVVELVRSLGGYATMKELSGRSEHSKELSTSYIAYIHIDINIFRLSRKANRFKPAIRKKDKVAVVSIEEVASVPTQCIAIDSEDHLYVAGDYVVTHNTNIRGVRYKGMRPDIAILDDITTNEAMTSETIQNTINQNFYKSVIPALHPTRFKIFFIGTPISERDLLHQLSNNPEWVVHKFPICERYPCTKEEFKGNWPDRFPYEAVKSKYDMLSASGQAQSFYQEYMLEIVDLSTLLVEEEDIKWFDPTIVKKHRDAYNIYITTDFATSSKKSADYSVISVWAINNNGDWMLVDGQCLRQSMQENLDDLFKYVHRWKPMSVGIEISGQQGGFISILEDMMVQKNTWFTLAKKRGSKEPGIRPTSDKVTRFVTGVQPMFKQGKVWFPKPELTKATAPKLHALVEELQGELSKFTLAGGVRALAHDDGIDTLSQLSEIDIWTPSEVAGDEADDGWFNDEGSIYWGDSKEKEWSGGSTVF